ncbi:MAG: hypothetical protein J5804_00605, partial [Eggerthellaceae bacterium]|nr:hypothetical protein [Eggerthellaceae bacterium]
MHLKIQKRDGREYLSVAQSYRENGKVKTRVVETIGYADAYADRFDDPVAHFRTYVDQLNRNAAAEHDAIDFSFDLGDEIEVNAIPPARLGASIALVDLGALLRELDDLPVGLFARYPYLLE